MPPRCPNRKIRSGSVAPLRLSIFFMRNIQKLNAPIGKIFPEKHCHFSGFRIYWKAYRSFLPAPQAGELSSCTAASGGKQAGKAKLPSPPAFLLFFYSAGIRIFSVAIAPYFRSPGAAIVPVPALSALLPNRLLHFSGFFDRPGFCPAFVQHWTPFCPAAGGASLIEPLWEASYPPVSIRRGPSVFYPSPK